MHVFVADHRMKDAWEEYVQQRPTIAWQSWEWFTVLSKNYDVTFLPIVATENSRICGILPLYLVSTLRAKRSLISVPYAVAGGIASDTGDAEKLLLAKAIDLYESLNCSSICLKQYKSKIEGDLSLDDNFYNRELNLTQSADTIWSAFAATNKQNIESARKHSITLDYPASHLDTFYKLLLSYHGCQGLPCVSKKWLQDLLEFQLYSIALLKSGNSILAGTMVKKHKKTVSFPFTCAPDLGQESNMFAFYLYWLLIKEFSEAGMEIFHSGRIPNTDATHEYRLGWGGVKNPYYYQYFPPTTVKTEFSTKHGNKRKLFTAAWKKMPAQLTRLVGPYIVKQFP